MVFWFGSISEYDFSSNRYDLTKVNQWNKSKKPRLRDRSAVLRAGKISQVCKTAKSRAHIHHRVSRKFRCPFANFM